MYRFFAWRTPQCGINSNSSVNLGQHPGFSVSLGIWSVTVLSRSGKTITNAVCSWLSRVLSLEGKYTISANLYSRNYVPGYFFYTFKSTLGKPTLQFWKYWFWIWMLSSFPKRSVMQDTAIINKTYSITNIITTRTFISFNSSPERFTKKYNNGK